MAKKAKPAEVPREGVNTRITKELREKLDAAAAQAGRSTGSEIERRLEQSFRFKQELLALFEDQKTFNVLASIAIAWADLEIDIGEKWYNSPDTIFAAQAAAVGILQSVRSLQGNSILQSVAQNQMDEDRKTDLYSLGFASADRVRDYVLKRPFDSDAAEASHALARGLFEGEPREGS